MSIINYYFNKCKYWLNRLDGVVYLISADASKDIVIDNGVAYISGITSTPISLKAYNVALNDTDELDERYKFTHQLTFSVSGYANYKDFQGNYYAIVKSKNGEYWLVNPMFPCKVTSVYTLDSNGSHTDFTLSTVSNLPSLKVVGLTNATPYVCDGYKHCTFNGLKLNEKNYSYKTNSNVVYTNEGFKDISFIKNSASFTEQFDGVNVQHSLKFDINSDDDGWHYNLLEFNDNKYSAIIQTSCGKYILTGFEYGLQPSFELETTPNVIHIEMDAMYDNGSFIGYEDNITIVNSGGTTYIWSSRDDAYECVGNAQARWLLKEEIDAFGNKTGNYKCLQGYESNYSYLNIVGTFSTTETFTNYNCGDPCEVATTLPNVLQFTNTTTQSYTLQSSSRWTLASSASHITLALNSSSTYRSSVSGNANTSYTVKVRNTRVPTPSTVKSTLTLSYCTSKQATYDVKVKSANSCLPMGNTYNINADGQYVTIPTRCCLNSVSGSSAITSIVIQEDYVKVYVPENNTTSARTFSLSATACDSSTVNITIQQSRCYIQWVKESEICDGYYKCDVERKYTGTTSSSINTKTDETRYTNCAQSEDCGYIEVFKLKYWFSGGTSGSKSCDSSSSITSSDYSSDTSIVRAEVGSCVTSIGNNAFSGTSLSSITIGNNVTSIGNNAFQNCTRMSSISIPNGVTSIGQYAFDSCYFLAQLSLGSNLASISKYAFSQCYLSAVTIPNSVTTIGDNAFEGNYNLRTLRIGSGLRQLGDNVFDGCWALTSVTIDDGIETISQGTFINCTSLPNIYIPSTVTLIDNDAFNGCTSLTSCTMSSAIETIGISTFQGCTGLTSLVYDGLTSLNTIGISGFSNCTSITYVHLPANIQYIGASAFKNCSSLTTIVLEGPAPIIASDTFSGCVNLSRIEVPNAYLDYYRNDAPVWKNYKNIIYGH